MYIWFRIRLNHLVLGFALAVSAAGQTFSSGSTGADGALDLTAFETTLQLPDSGILNYTTVNIPAGTNLYFKNNPANTPVIMLAQGTVKIAGRIWVSAPRAIFLDSPFSAPGPGGFYGGDPGVPGFGPGGGPIGGPGQWVGPLSLVPNIGGSGGGGYSSPGCTLIGGGGGGAITIASSVSITVDSGGGFVSSGSPGGNFCFGSGLSSYGASGAIRLVSNSISCAGGALAEIARLEAPLGALQYTGNSSSTRIVLSTINPLIVPTHPPSITISSVGGYQVPPFSGSSFSTIDLLLPSQLQDPVPVVVQATNVPVGSPVRLSFSGSAGATSTTATLSGTTASSTATMNVSGLTRTGVTYIFVLATFDPALIASNVKQVGPNAVSRIELAAAPGKATTYRFLRRNGTEVSLSKVSAELRRALGL